MKRIYNRRIAMALRQMGNPLIDCEINKNKEFYIKLKEEEFKVELIKFSDTLNKALVYIPEKNRLEDVYVNELIIKDIKE